jgi:hypothetical protein
VCFGHASRFRCFYGGVTMMLRKFIASGVLALACATAVNLHADFVSPEAELVEKKAGFTSFPLTIAEPFVVFKSVGAKYPYMLRFDPAENTFTSVMCGTEIDGSPRLAKTAQDLEALIPVRRTVKALDAGIQIDRKYDGFRESYIGCMIAGALTLTGILPQETYPGTFLVDEMTDGVAMKWVLRNAEEFKSVRQYLENKIAEKGLTFAKKPSLLIDIRKGGANLDASDYAFLNAYFTLVSPTDESTMEFYNKATAIMTDITTCGVDFGNAAEGFGIKFMRLIEKDCSDFKLPEWCADGAKLAFTALTTAILIKLFNDYVSTPAQGKAKNAVGSAGEYVNTKVGEFFPAAQ